MKLQDIQVSKCTSHVHVPFAASWSQDNVIAMATDMGVYLMAAGRSKFKPVASILFYISCIFLLITSVESSDITNAVFGNQKAVLPAAFGDFNSDEYPDLFVIRNHKKTIEVLLGSDTEPLVRSVGIKCDFTKEVTSIVPGDFDGDALMDILVTLKDPINETLNYVNIIWGEGGEVINCTQNSKVNFKVYGQPLALDYNQDMIIDLFGEEEEGRRAFWVFDKSRGKPKKILMNEEVNNRKFHELRIPHSHSFLDLTGDSAADLYITTKQGFEVWVKERDQRDGFKYDPNRTIPLPPNANIVGQTLFMDMELKGKIDHILPVCFDSLCKNSTIYVYSNGKWHNLKINFHFNGAWGFVPPPRKNDLFLDAITLRGGDFNMDGYPDALATLQDFNGNLKTYLLVNEACVSPANCNEFNRTFTVHWTALDPVNNNTIMGVFYDFMQDGILDIIFVHGHGPGSKKGNVSAFKNSLDYDANFVKVMVLTGLKDKEQPVIPGPLGRKNRTYGTNLPGPIISYHTTTQEGLSRAAICPQLPQSAYFSLNLPYTLFGLGRTPNFLETLNVGLSGYSRQWTQIIPNSQMVVIPLKLENPSQWIARLFVTPSKLIVKSFVALLGTCLLISLIIGILYWKERREDHYEKRQEAHRFHFDGM
ncbi:hypothetical protein O3M35_012343 [Rhynocoris fuscipes]